ncbi:hypothetical protein M378DRAFT_176103 [Amanita muscaria Koide BX008]|uniref:Uncharacterized protein n=1 Tax=Amanita muscaria (strain Koide BX008) TaxID=946122 RepID=A0A0C2T011_AMAMK|nr:hypothetical protein M378DRAFT_176103 [Amanita muscaria Koide BX008]
MESTKEEEPQYTFPSCLLGFVAMLNRRDFAVICDDVFMQSQSMYRNSDSDIDHDQNQQTSTDLSVALIGVQQRTGLTSAEINLIFSRLEIFHAQHANWPDNLRDSLTSDQDPTKLASLVMALLDFTQASLLSIIFIVPQSSCRLLRSVARAGDCLQRLSEILLVSPTLCPRKPMIEEMDECLRAASHFHSFYLSLGNLPARISAKVMKTPHDDNGLLFNLLTLINATLLLIMSIQANCYTSQDEERHIDLIYTAGTCVLSAQEQLVK